MRFLEGYAYGATTLVIILSITAFRQSRNTKFDEIDVQRINIVEANGRVRMTLSGHDKLPDPVIGGKSYRLRSGDGGRGAGVIFFNDEGNEDGGLTFNGRKTDSGYVAGAGLSFDQFNQDETVTLSYHDQNGKREAGLDIADRPNVPIKDLADSAMVYRSLPEGPDKTRRFEEFRKNMIAKGEFGDVSRVYVGKRTDKQSIVMLADRQGHPRIKLTVDSLGTPSMQFLAATAA